MYKIIRSRYFTTSIWKLPTKFDRKSELCAQYAYKHKTKTLTGEEQMSSGKMVDCHVSLND
jgi:hypothetical protein